MDSTSRLDEALVAAAYESRSRPLARQVRRAFGLSAGDAEEVVQDAFVALLEARGEIRHPADWLARVAHRLAARRVRRARVLVPLDALAGHAAPRLDIEAVLDLRRALASLSARARTVVALRYLAGLTTVEIARHTGLRPANVRQVLGRGVTSLRRWLTRKGSWPDLCRLRVS